MNVMPFFLAGKEGIKHAKNVDYFSVGYVDKRAGTAVLKSRDSLHCALEVDGERMQQRYLALQTLSTKLAITPIALMNGRPKMTYTATSRPVLTRSEILLPSLVR
jgi:hypothetical protein